MLAKQRKKCMYLAVMSREHCAVVVPVTAIIENGHQLVQPTGPDARALRATHSRSSRVPAAQPGHVPGGGVVILVGILRVMGEDYYFFK